MSVRTPNPTEFEHTYQMHESKPGECVNTSTITIRDNGHGQDIGPAPQWTTTPPTEPGWYWRRFPLHDVHAFVVLIVPSIDGLMVRHESAADEDVRFDTDIVWWPVRIEEPPR